VLVSGDKAPEFTGRTADGGAFRLSDLRGSSVVLYFYPRANSLGCTRESVSFALLHGALGEKGVRIVGVSVDDVNDQRRFAEKCSLPFPLVADASKEIARLYGVLGAFGHAKRVTFFIDPEGRVVDTVDSILPGPHVDRARRLWLASGPAPSAAARPPAP
jgi:peroxiredoxin Q/BCP